MSQTNTIAAACCGTASTAIGLAAPHIFCITSAVTAFSGASISLSEQSSQGLAVVGISAAAAALYFAYRKGRNTFIMATGSILAGFALSAGFNELTGRHHAAATERHEQAPVCTPTELREAAEIGVDCATYQSMCRTREINP